MTTDEGDCQTTNRKEMKVKIGRETWRAGNQREKRTPRIVSKVLREMEKKEEFDISTEDLIEEVQQEGLVVRKEERHRMLTKMRTVEEMNLLEHKPMNMKIGVNVRR